MKYVSDSLMMIYETGFKCYLKSFGKSIIKL